jgi:F-type H+-transporting ATPase subunit a
MVVKCLKHTLVVLFAFFALLSPSVIKAQDSAHIAEVEHHEDKEEGLDPAKIIMDHIKDAHEFHFFTIENKENKHESFHATIPLPIILYVSGKGLKVFSSSKFGHEGEEQVVDGLYKYDENKDIVTTDGSVVYDFSLTKNVVQMIIALTLLVVLMTGIAKKYKNGYGVTTAPKGWQNAVEPVITFVRDEVAKPNLKNKWSKYLPYLLTVFFFILINNLFGLLPGSANVTGNIAFTLVLGLVSLIVILFSSNKHFWGHIFWFPGVPLLVRIFIMLPVELLGVFTKPFALIVRLFANMVAGHIIILSFISLIFIFGSMNAVAGWGFSPLSIAFAVFIYLIEIMVAFIQAFIFTNLTAVFIGQAFEGEHDHAEGEGHHAHA